MHIKYLSVILWVSKRGVTVKIPIQKQKQFTIWTCWRSLGLNQVTSSFITFLSALDCHKDKS